MTLPDVEWHAGAACHPDRLDPATRRAFYATNDAGMERAALICRRCDVRTDCLVHALAEREEHGVWGGKTPRERMLLLARLPD